MLSFMLGYELEKEPVDVNFRSDDGRAECIIMLGPAPSLRERQNGHGDRSGYLLDEALKRFGWSKNETQALPMSALADAIAARIPERIEALKRLVILNGKTAIHTLTVENIVGGMREAPALLWEASETTEYGVRIHGRPLQELLFDLPKWKKSQQASPEAMTWFLYTAQYPTQSQLEHFVADLASRAVLPEDVSTFVDSLPHHLSPLTKLTMGVAALARHSKLTKALNDDTRKSELWRFALEDSLDLVPRGLLLISRIYAKLYRPNAGAEINSFDPTKDFADNFSAAIGRESDTDFAEVLRLYWVLHMEHGVNVSAHVMHLCGSAWTDVYLSATASMCAGTGALHAGAIQRSLQFNAEMQDTLGPNPTDDDIATYLSNAITRGKVIPGYGHAILRHKDPRLQIILDFISKKGGNANGDAKMGPKSSNLHFLARVAQIAPAVLRKHIPHMRSTFPNVDTFSGSVLRSYGVEAEFLLPIIFSCRGSGEFVQYVWDRALGSPIERPLSLTINELSRKCSEAEFQPLSVGSYWTSVRFKWRKLVYRFAVRAIKAP